MDILVMSGRFVALKSLEEAVERARPKDNQHKLSTPSGHRCWCSLVLSLICPVSLVLGHLLCCMSLDLGPLPNDLAGGGS